MSSKPSKSIFTCTYCVDPGLYKTYMSLNVNTPFSATCLLPLIFSKGDYKLESKNSIVAKDAGIVFSTDPLLSINSTVIVNKEPELKEALEWTLFTLELVSVQSSKVWKLSYLS